MRIGFAGTPDFARVALQALIEAEYEVALALTQPDRPAGRGMKLQASPVKQLAQQQGIVVWQPHSLRTDGRYAEEASATKDALEQAKLDVLVVAAYGLILPKWVLDLPTYGCLNIHASMLPRWRGAAPIHRAIEAGDACTGITIMQMDEGLDTGDMLLSRPMAIAETDTTGSLHDRLALLGGEMIVQTLAQLQASQLEGVPQPDDGITYAHKIDKAESWVDWNKPAEQILHKINAFNPFPVAQTCLNGQTIKIWTAQPWLPGPQEQNAIATPGQILQSSSSGIDVACGQQTQLRLTELQRAGGKRLPVSQWLNGFTLQPGDVFSQPEKSNHSKEKP